MAASEVVQVHDDISLDKAAASLRAAMLNSFFSKKELKPAVLKHKTLLSAWWQKRGLLL